MSRALDDLDDRIKPLAFELIARAAEHGIPLLLVDTLRTPAEQAVNVARGVSWTLHSRHLPQPPDGKALAFDVVPYSLYNDNGPDKLNWSEDHPSWAIIGQIGLKLGLTWGVTRSGTRIDLGHFEWRVPDPP